MELRLYVAGTNLLSARARDNLRAILEQAEPGAYALEIVDLIADPERADEYRILATPTLVRMSPKPVRKLIGDLSDAASVRAHLGIPAPPPIPDTGI